MKQQPTFKQIRRLVALSIATLIVMSGCVPAVSPVTPAEVSIFCPDIARPAMLLLLPDDTYALFDPASGESCPLAFAESVPGMVVMAQEDFFVASHTVGPEGAALVIQRYRGDGTVEALPYTLIDAQAGVGLVAFTVSADARLIAWSVLGPTAGQELPATSLLIADLATGKTLIGVAPEVGDAPRTLAPIRFSDDGSHLYYAMQPYGLGGIWSSYDGRYANLYAIAIDGSGGHTPIFDCADYDHALCLGDFLVVNNVVTALARVDRGAASVVVQNGVGEVLKTFQAPDQYVGYPRWGRSGELVYYTANLSADTTVTTAPSMGYLHRVTLTSPPTETVISDTALLLPIGYFDDRRVVVGWTGENETRGLALIGVDGAVQKLDVPAGAFWLGPVAVSTLLGVNGGGGIVSFP